MDPGIPAEPGALAPDEAPRRRYGVRRRLLLGALTGQVPQDLLVPEGAAGGAAVPQPVRGEVLYDAAPYGVQYTVASWEPA